MRATQNIVVFGVSGCGKSTIGIELAQKLDLPFFDADDFHPKENIEKMTNGIPLIDSDRLPWLNQINHFLRNQPNGWVLACSALKESYRKIICDHIIEINWVHLSGRFEEINRRLQKRSNHFMKADMLRSQFDDLEIPEYAFSVSIEYPPSQIVKKIINQIRE